MSEANEKNPFDPFDALRGMRDASMDAWSKVMIQTVNSEAYSKANGAMLDAYLTASAPFREIIEKAVTQSLQNLNLPTRTDFISLAERLTNVEMKLDDLDAKLDLLTSRVAEPGAAGPEPSKHSPRDGKETKKESK